MSAAEWVGIGVTGLASLATAYMAGQTRKSIKSTQKVIDAANRQVLASEWQGREAVKARVDARSPRVVVIVSRPQWPPREAAISGHAGAKPAEIGPDVRYQLPMDQDRRIGLMTYGLLRNDGHSTAVVQLSGARFQDPFAASVSGRFSGVDLGNQTMALPPGDQIGFEFFAVRPIIDWVTAYEERTSAPAESKCHFEVIARDTFDEGIADNILVEVQAYPVEPVPGNAAGWMLSGQHPEPCGAVAYGSKRRYFASKTLNEEMAPIADRGQRVT
jgi:hypothetical protein